MVQVKIWVCVNKWEFFESLLHPTAQTKISNQIPNLSWEALMINEDFKKNSPLCTYVNLRESTENWKFYRTIRI